MLAAKSHALALYGRFPHEGQDIVERDRDFGLCEGVMMRLAELGGDGALSRAGLEWADRLWDERWPDIPYYVEGLLEEELQNLGLLGREGGGA